MPNWLSKLTGGSGYFRDIGDDAVLYVRTSHDESSHEPYPLVMLFSPGMARVVRGDGYEYVTALCVHFAESDTHENRMPFGEAVMEVRETLEHQLPQKFAAEKCDAKLIGTQTGGGSRTYFFLVKSAQDAERTLQDIECPRGAQVNVFSRPASEMIAWLQPNRLESAAIRDEDVRRVLADRGDDGTRPRDARFYFYSGDLDSLESVALELGFKVERTTVKDGLILSRDSPVTAAAFDELNRIFFDWVDQFGVDYDGWEAALLVN